jgi:hypothetical protein
MVGCYFFLRREPLIEKFAVGAIVFHNCEILLSEREARVQGD